MQAKRTALLAVVLTAALAPAASARVAVEPSTGTAKHHRVQPAAKYPGYADMAARREVVTSRQWQQAARAPIVDLATPQDGGFDLPSALIGGAVPLIVLILGLVSRPVYTRRRSRVGLA